MYVYGQLKEAQLDNQSSDPGTLSQGLVWLNTASKKAKYYDGVTTRTLATGSAGSGSLVWVPDDAGAAPIKTIENQQGVWLFSPAQTQKLFTVIKVPSGYSSGDPISLLISAYSSAVSSSFLLQSLATLIRNGTDGFNSTTNQRTSTNSAQSNGSPAQILRQITLDLTSTTGTINSVAVSAGDLIKVQLARGSDADIQDVRFIESSGEVLFS